ncbi:hypothetical protein QTO34_012361 [Cnephaeus nilssonii]|uniref:Uncharacterized protein n=1 Tax=Cnephaeus nilssonii TaxID=3371016 RepID=A0AA40HAZ5_CNENI|nr:hypothetical protein QTO34_012361 [Eptesicus nilssonii]
MEVCTPGLQGGGGQGLTWWSHPVLLPGSASVRLPVKLGEKLERYHTAIQVGPRVPRMPLVLRAGAGAPRGGQCPSSPPAPPATEVFVAPVGVASKRHLFEKELGGQSPSRAEPASSRRVRGAGPPRPEVPTPTAVARALPQNAVFSNVHLKK